eukprot:CAMPEP_0178516786 /NCGR_PEP_ID=MMETSP0696-20121128/25318_1 /TAXON_ID=265572 /ORGANISM="Extubocellulus spinifer, Strain CCMP396" /LENGTH=151 /DNA_ID=CAMNT_0020147123 /DNA_START=27 /DNA_END=482 /DNA_ORIENTATION=-
MTSKLLSLVKIWPRVTGRVHAPPASSAAADIINFLLGREAAEEGEFDSQAAFLERLSEETGFAAGPPPAGSLPPPDVVEEARRVREEAIRRHYRSLTHPAPRSSFEAASYPLSDATLAHMQEEESRRIERPNLDIPVHVNGGGFTYVTLAQ